MASSSSTQAPDSTTDGGGAFLDDPQNMATYVVLPVMIFVYGGCCVIYCVARFHRFWRRRARQKREEDSTPEQRFSPATQRPTTNTNTRQKNKTTTKKKRAEETSSDNSNNNNNNDEDLFTVDLTVTPDPILPGVAPATTRIWTTGGSEGQEEDSGTISVLAAQDGDGPEVVDSRQPGLSVQQQFETRGRDVSGGGGQSGVSRQPSGSPDDDDDRGRLTPVSGSPVHTSSSSTGYTRRSRRRGGKEEEEEVGGGRGRGGTRHQGAVYSPRVLAVETQAGYVSRDVDRQMKHLDQQLKVAFQLITNRPLKASYRDSGPHHTQTNVDQHTSTPTTNSRRSKGGTGRAVQIRVKPANQNAWR